MTTNNLNFKQINLHNCKAATALLAQTLLEEKTDIALIQDPYVNDNRIHGFPKTCQIYSSSTLNAAIIICNPLISHIHILKTQKKSSPVAGMQYWLIVYITILTFIYIRKLLPIDIN